jgi:uncharacterized phage-associated protein
MALWKGDTRCAMNPSAPYDARAIANFLLELGDERQLPLTQVTVLKLLYFSHGWYLAIKRVPLIVQEFEAWQYGPVVKVVRDAFKVFGSSPITARASKVDIRTNQSVTVTPNLAKDDARFVKSIFDAYHVYDAWALSDMTHEPGSPWDEIWNSSEPVGRLALRIKNEDIQSHFVRFPSRFRLS